MRVFLKIWSILFLVILNTATALCQNEFEILANGYYQEGKTSQAAEYYNKAGYAYWNRGDKENAAQAFEKAYSIFQQSNNYVACITLSNNLGLIYSELENNAKAETAFTNALYYARLLKNTHEIYNSLVNLSNIKIERGKYNEAIQNAKMALDIASEMNNLKNIGQCYSLLAESYEKAGDSKNAYKYFELYSATDKKIKQQEIELLKDMSTEEINRAQQQKQVAEIELKIKKGELKITQDSLFMAEKLALQRQIEINQKTAQLEQKELQLKYERNLRWLITSGLVVFMLFSVALILSLNRIKKQKEEITRQRNELNVKNKNITDSIFYGQRIQNAMLPDLSSIKDNFEAGLLYLPKDIVSGDFYWYRKVKFNDLEYDFFAVVDCTGHGVPGAFMSMIGNRLLNEIIGVRNKIEPSEILYYLNESLSNELRRTSTHTVDGMDIALCRFLEVADGEYELVFAGAKRPLIIYEKEKKSLQLIEGNLFSIGNLKKNTMKTYLEKHFILHRGDTVLMYSDGIIDQPNTERNKFGTPRFLCIANDLISMSLANFMVALQNAYDTFRDKEIQRDDITVLAISLK
jgi:serine phosphatase RsbU (regulator of sigma subunit)/Flp pilus assembly protein TadD